MNERKKAPVTEAAYAVILAQMGLFYIIGCQTFENLIDHLSSLVWIRFENSDFKIKFVPNTYYGSPVFR